MKVRDLDKSSSGEVSVKGKYLLGIGLRKKASRETRDSRENCFEEFCYKEE